MLPDLDELAEAIGAALEASGVPYALGGALCLAVWGVPRATRDIDLNVFVTDAGLAPVFEALESAGCTVDRPSAGARAVARGDFVATTSGVRIDVFVAFHPFHDEARARSLEVSGPKGRPLRVLSAEDLMVFKTLFGRTKDFADIERLVARRGAMLDAAHVLKWIDALLPPDDPRPARIRALLARFVAG